ncbi:MAG: hypothetical protein ABI216_22145 [Devosia sp.]
MKLIDNWKQILKESWTAQLAYASTIIGGIGQALTYTPESILVSLSLNAAQMSYVGGILAAFGLLLTAIIPPARVVMQPALTVDKEND